MFAPASVIPGAPTIRSPTPAGAPIILAGHRLPTLSTMSPTMPTTTMLNTCPPLVSPTDGCQQLLYPYDPYSLAMATGAAPLLEYPGVDHSAAGMSYVR